MPSVVMTLALFHPPWFNAQTHAAAERRERKDAMETPANEVCADDATVELTMYEVFCMLRKHERRRIVIILIFYARPQCASRVRSSERD